MMMMGFMLFNFCGTVAIQPEVHPETRILSLIQFCSTMATWSHLRGFP